MNKCPSKWPWPRIFEIHETIERVSMKGPIEIEQSSNLIS
jgi:hypothetical protein